MGGNCSSMEQFCGGKNCTYTLTTAKTRKMVGSIAKTISCCLQGETSIGERAGRDAMA